MPEENEPLTAAPAETVTEANEEQKAPAKKIGVTLKVSEKGALSVYGLGRFPVTLYKEQWVRLLEHTNEIREFLGANDEKLKKKEA